MKKLIIAAAIVCAAVISQAATFSWTASSVMYEADITKLSGNTSVAASTSTRARGNGTWSWALEVYAAGTDTLLDSDSGTFSIAPSGKPSLTGISLSGVGDGVAIDYVLTITGQQTDLRAITDLNGWNYSSALVSSEISGSLTTDTMGDTVIPSSGSPSSWTVSGATPTGPVPEPTSGLLLLLGVAGLALRRRRA